MASLLTRIVDGLTWQPKRAWVRHSLPLLALLACLLLQGAIQGIFHPAGDFPYAIFYLVAVLVVAWFGGYVPGVVLCLIVLVGLPAAVARTLNLSPDVVSRLVLMTAVSLAVSWVATSQRRARQILRGINEDLDRRVQLRTKELEAEIEQHRQTEQKLQIQIERLHLLDQITRAIGERQDLPSVFQVAVRSVEDDLPVDLAIAFTYDPADSTLTVASAGLRGESLAAALNLTLGATVPIDTNGLSRCVSGRLVYEADIAAIASPFPQRLTAAGLRSIVIAPLLVESNVFGVFLAARRHPGAFSSSDCEFLRQLSEHVALAAHQTQIHAALQQAYDDLRQTQQAVFQQEGLRALGQMASGIAHDINNALSPVSLYTDILLEREQNLSPDARKHLETTQRAIEDVANTLGRMREFYRPQDMQSRLAAVNLNPLVQQVLDLTRVRWSDIPQQRGVVIDVRTELTHAIPGVSGIESEIREALTNLIFNAIDAMPDGGMLTIRTAASAAGGAQLEVVDSGIGMDEDTRRRCLEPFFTTKGERGTGLGLAMVYGSVQRHGADIEIDSAPQQGTTFRVIFPVPLAAQSAAAISTTPANPARLRLLVIDDDPVLIRSLRDSLDTEGHTVVAAHGGKEGVAAFQAAIDRAEPFAIVITDLGMPHMDGRRVAEAIKTASPHTPVILLTGWGQRLLDEGDLPPHVDRVLSKPPKLRDLRSALADLSFRADAAP